VRLTARRKILIVDDDPNVCEFLSEALKDAGYDTLTARDGREGLEKALFAGPDLILLDIKMPGMDGWQVLSCLRREAWAKHIPVVMLTAKSETESVVKSQELNVLDYFIKPIDAHELVSFIRRYVDLRPADDE
jgi:DNA-binding response OmpR family regulator